MAFRSTVQFAFRINIVTTNKITSAEGHVCKLNEPFIPPYQWR